MTYNIENYAKVYKIRQLFLNTNYKNFITLGNIRKIKFENLFLLNMQIKGNFLLTN